MQQVIAQDGESTIRDLELNELDAVSGGWSIGTTGDGGVRVDAGAAASPSGAMAPLIGTAAPSGITAGKLRLARHQRSNV